MNIKLSQLYLVTSLIAAPVFMQSAQAAEPIVDRKAEQQSESMSFGIGAVVGGIVAGPFGAFATGLLSSLLVKQHHDKENIGQLQTALTDSEQQQQQQVAKLKQQMQRAEQQYQRELLAQEQNYHKASQLQLENLLMSLQFSTGSSDIAPHYQEQINALAALLQQSENMTVDLSGYTDLQGNAALNKALSEARVAAVKQALVEQGIAANRISTTAFGDSAPVVASNDKPISFYDRRVVIRLHQAEQQTAKN